MNLSGSLMKTQRCLLEPTGGLTGQKIAAGSQNKDIFAPFSDNRASRGLYFPEPQRGWDQKPGPTGTALRSSKH